jgi:hypothetical protein
MILGDSLNMLLFILCNKAVKSSNMDILFSETKNITTTLLFRYEIKTLQKQNPKNENLDASK